MIGEIVREAACPVIAVLTVGTPSSRRGRQARSLRVHRRREPGGAPSAIDITLQRFAEFTIFKVRSGAGRRSSRRRGS